MRQIFQGIAILAIAALSPGAQAALLNVQNADFESGRALADGEYAAQHIFPNPGWGLSGGSGTGRWNPGADSFSDEAAYGVVGFASGDGITPFGATASQMAQTIAGEVLRANTRYTLTIDVGSYFGNSDRGYSFGLISQYGTSATRILAESKGDLGPQGSFKSVQLVFETDSQCYGLGKEFSIALSSLRPNFGGGAAFDNVRLDASSLAVVPEPASWALMITGFGLVGSAARRRPAAMALA